MCVWGGHQQGSRAGLKNPDGRIFREIKILPRLGQDCRAHRKAWQDLFFVASAGRGRGWIFYSPCRPAGGRGRIFFAVGGLSQAGLSARIEPFWLAEAWQDFFRPQRNKNPTTPRARFSGSPGGVAGFFLAGYPKILPAWQDFTPAK